MGRNSKYDPDFVDIAKSMCRKGATDENLAERFGVHANTICTWKKEYTDFYEAIKEGKDRSIEKVENALYKSAESGNITACIFVLCNRARRNWQNVQRQIHSGVEGDDEQKYEPIKIVLQPVPDELKNGSK